MTTTGTDDPTTALTLQFLTFVAGGERTYGETMEAWRSTCPRMSIWEDAIRDGLRLGHGKLIDSMIHDGLWDPYNDVHMGNCAELCATEYHLSREEQDAYSVESYRRAREATFRRICLALIAAAAVLGLPSLDGMWR